jgi:hypothetical protein
MDRQLVQEHLRALVRVGRLHAGDEPDRVVVLEGDEQMMAFAGEEPRRPLLGGRSIEEVGAGQNDLLVAGS